MRAIAEQPFWQKDAKVVHDSVRDLALAKDTTHGGNPRPRPISLPAALPAGCGHGEPAELDAAGPVDPGKGKGAEELARRRCGPSGADDRGARRRGRAPGRAGRRLRAASAPRSTRSSPTSSLVWGDDQYENFKEDVIPPFAVLAYDDLDARTRERCATSSTLKRGQRLGRGRRDARTACAGRPDIARRSTTGLLERRASTSPTPTSRCTTRSLRARLPQHGPLPRLPPDRVPVADRLPCPINCYGRRVVAAQGCVRAPRTRSSTSTRRRRRRAGSWTSAAPRRAWLRRQPLAGRARGLVVVVARLPHRPHLAPAPRHARRPPALRGARRRRLRRLGATSLDGESSTPASRRCSTGSRSPARWRSWGVGSSGAPSSRRSSSTRTRCSPFTGPPDARAYIRFARG